MSSKYVRCDTSCVYAYCCFMLNDYTLIMNLAFLSTIDKLMLYQVEGQKES